MKQHLIPSFCTLLLLLIPLKTSAQLSRYGGGLSFSPGIDNTDYKTGNPGFNGRAVFEINKKLMLVPSITFYLPKKFTFPGGVKRTTYFGSLDVNGTYTLATEGPLLFYALAGGNASLVSGKYSGDDPTKTDNTEFFPGLNIGTGIEMIVDKKFNADIQVKYVVGKYQYLAISLGVHYYPGGRRYKSW